MNFSRYINMLRLREMEALRNDPACSRLPEEERACLAGFSNFRSYQRVKRDGGEGKIDHVFQRLENKQHINSKQDE